MTKKVMNALRQLKNTEHSTMFLTVIQDVNATWYMTPVMAVRLSKNEPLAYPLSDIKADKKQNYLNFRDKFKALCSIRVKCKDIKMMINQAVINNKRECRLIMYFKDNVIKISPYTANYSDNYSDKTKIMGMNSKFLRIALGFFTPSEHITLSFQDRNNMLILTGKDNGVYIMPFTFI